MRRLRDLLRSNVLHGRYHGDRLPAEAELMTAHRASRAVVREALAELAREGSIERIQGLGTYAVHHAVVTRIVETHGTASPTTGEGVWSGAHRPRVLDSSVVPTPDTVRAHLGPDCGPRCLRLDYVAMLDDEPIGLATNYLRFPEADRVRDVPFTSDFYAFLGDAGLHVGASEFLIGCVNADPLTAEQLEVEPGAALMTMEQVIFDADGRPYDFAFVITRADRFMLLSRAERGAPAVAGG